MKIKFYLVSLFAISFMSAQNIADKKKIVGSYDFNKSIILQNSLKKNEEKRQLRINDYLKSNPTEKSSFSVGGQRLKISDIIEGKPVYIATDNASSAASARISKLRPGGGMGLNLEGFNMTVGVWDGGWILGTHTEFNTSSTSTVSRVSFPDSGVANPPSDSHGTHVGGTVGARGANTSAKGMAPKVKIKSYNWDNDEFEVAAEALSNGLLVSNHSYGVPIYNNGNMNVPNWYMGCYIDVAVEWDEIAYTHPYYLMVASAGNSGNEDYSGGLTAGLDKLTGNKNSKNNLVIANASASVNPISGIITNLIINTGSSQGPTDDGRIKPDIAADGTAVTSTYNTNNTSYEQLTGTSMASPCVAGGVTLLQEHYNNLNSKFMRSATLRGLVCHTALDDPQIAGPDPKFGWGMLDAQAAALAISNSAANNNQALILESELNATTSTYTMSFSATNPSNVKATICWTDPAGTAKNGALNSPTPVLVNDLDLRISQGSTTYLPWKFDLANLNGGAIKGDNIVDNIERVEVTEATSGTYTLTVTHKGTLTTGAQPFSLILTGTGLVLGTEENTLNPITYWPNPTTDKLYYKLANGNLAQSVKVYDVSGKQMNLKVTNDFIDVSSLQQGVYILKLNTDSSSDTYKFIKK